MGKISKGILVSVTALVLSLVSIAKTFAVDFTLPPIGPDMPPLEEWIVGLLNWAIGLSALVAVAFIIFAGFMYITANGDENKIAKATKTLTFAIVGLVVCFIAGMLVNFILTNFLGQ